MQRSKPEEKKSGPGKGCHPLTETLR